MPKAHRKKIIWAVDPFGEAKIQASAGHFAESLSLHNDVDVVYVHGRSGFPILSEQAAIRFDLAKVELQLENMLAELKFKPHKKPQILAHGAEFVRTDVKTLVSYAKKIKADAVLVSTNARAGLLRQALGSFAETLILESSIPIMIVNPKAKVLTKPGTILFPTDFSDMSWKAFEHVIHFAKASHAHVKLFHQYLGEEQNIPDNVSYFQNDRWLEGDRLLDDNLQKVKLHLSKWLNWAKKQNVHCDHIIKFGMKNIADATLELATKENSWMIAMATMTGPLSAAFLGSNARWVVRAAQCPVWVLYIKGK